MRDRRLRCARLMLWASLIGLIVHLSLIELIVHLIDGDKPGSGGIAERLAEGLPLRAIDYARTYHWWISLGSVALVVALLATLRRWIGPPRAVECPDLAAPDRGGRAVAAVAALAMLTAALMAAPRLDFSFAEDERHTVRHSVDGEYVRNGEGDLVFREVRWRDTWLYTLNSPNNHVPFSLLARLSLGAWRAVAQPELRFASERAVRFPAFVFGIAAIGALAWCLWRVGLPWAAGFAAIFLAIHPWHLRYTSEARGYSLLLLCIPLLLGAMFAVLHRGTWRRWLAFGLVEVVLLWVFPGGVAILGVANAALLFEIWRRHRGALHEPVARWLVTSCSAAALFMLLMGANLLIFLWHSEWDREPITWKYIRDVLSHLWVGTDFAVRHAPEHYPELRDVARAAPVFFHAALAATGALCLLGAVRLALRARAGALLLLVMLLPAPLMILGAHLRETRIHEWYVIFALPSFAILLGAGLGGLFAWLRPPARGRRHRRRHARLPGRLRLALARRALVPTQCCDSAEAGSGPDDAAQPGPVRRGEPRHPHRGLAVRPRILRSQHPRDLEPRAASRSPRRIRPHRPRALRQLRAGESRPPALPGAGRHGGARGSLRACSQALRLRAARAHSRVPLPGALACPS